MKMRYVVEFETPEDSGPEELDSLKREADAFFEEELRTDVESSLTKV